MITAATCQAVFDQWVTHHRIRAVWLRDFPDAIGPTSSSKSRRVTVYRFTAGNDPAARLAEAAHEIAHVLEGPCPRRPPHEPHRQLMFMNCLACETAATSRAERLVRRTGVPWTFAMHTALSHGLRSYRRTTPAPATAHEALNTLASDGRYAERAQARLTRELQIAEIAAIAASPRYVTREERERQTRLRQWADIQHIAKGTR